ncbi:hypothetical protein PHYBOEH_011278 [Phytophthora boehmeriae]|uniref:Uncharacterized protein n=1 Tax=Phytophthora boehmeriae TaxID=109152 RepID=A0A8T1VLA7_9STRA|nr:hypothetical protein PHYBOEH_011278 [Phytophthora boehmeriae]
MDPFFNQLKRDLSKEDGAFDNYFKAYKMLIRFELLYGPNAVLDGARSRLYYAQQEYEQMAEVVTDALNRLRAECQRRLEALPQQVADELAREACSDGGYNDVSMDDGDDEGKVGPSLRTLAMTELKEEGATFTSRQLTFGPDIGSSGGSGSKETEDSVHSSDDAEDAMANDG